MTAASAHTASGSTSPAPAFSRAAIALTTHGSALTSGPVHQSEQGPDRGAAIHCLLYVRGDRDRCGRRRRQHLRAAAGALPDLRGVKLPVADRAGPPVRVAV